MRFIRGGGRRSRIFGGDVATAVGRALGLYGAGAGGGGSASSGAVGAAGMAGAGRVLTGVDVLEATRFGVLREMAGRHGGRSADGAADEPDGARWRGAADDRRAGEGCGRGGAGVALKVLFSPEHGIAGVKDSARVGSSVDGATGLPVVSLYGPKDADKRPRMEDLKALDAVVVDLQDAGVRFYTYEAVLGYFVEACAKAGVELVVLDRPALVGGVAVEGPMSDAGGESYTDYMPMPVRHGMTMGELARYDNGEKALGAKVTVVPMQGWRRAEFFDETGVPWVNPSPNLRTEAAAVVYPGVAFLEVPDMSVGRGSETPFEVFGAAWMKGEEVAAALNATGDSGGAV